MAKQDYLTERGQVEMAWEGKGAAKLGLTGQVQENHFARLCAGRDPFSDEKLTPRDNGANRRVCYFGQISAPKDVSIAYLVGGDERLAGWWNDSVKETLQEIEGVTSTRVRLKGAIADRSTGNMVAAVVTHDTSRSLDPQLHTHVCIMNVTFDEEENRWKAVEPRGYYKYQSYLREVSYNKLTEKMKQGGYRLEKSRSGGFTIRGFSSELRDNFSKRREDIERVADAMKTRDQDIIQSIAFRTRAEKVHLSADQLRARWLSESKDYLPQIHDVLSESKRVNKVSGVIPSRVLDLGEEHVFERQSVVDERILLRESLIAGRGDVTLKGLKTALASRLDSGSLVQNGPVISSRVTVEAEKSVIEWAVRAKGSQVPMGMFTPQTSLTSEQNRAAEKLLASRDGIAILIGDAGAGKSTTLPVIVRGVHETGNLTFACAPSSGAAQELQDKLGIQTDTVQQLLVNEKLQDQMAGRVIIVDEAGLLSIRQMQALFELAERQKSRLLLVGDAKQHHSVEAGDALRALQKYAKVETVRLKEIHRQEGTAYRKIVGLLASGKAHSAFGELDRLGNVHEQGDWNKLLNHAAATYADKVQTGQSCLAISPVWSEVNAFSAVLRDELKQRGLLGKEDVSYTAVQSLQWTRSLKSQVSNYQTGDVLTFHQQSEGFSKHEVVTVAAKTTNGLTLARSDGSLAFFDPKEGSHFDVGLSRRVPVARGEKLLVRANFAPGKLRNGDLVTVEEVKSDGSLLLQDGRNIPSHFRQFTHGYATTSHAAQGKTVDHGILVIGEQGCKASNLKQAYVSNSRFRKSQTIFAKDKQAAFDSMANETERPLSLEAIAIRSSRSQIRNEKPDSSVNSAAAAARPNESIDWAASKAKTGIAL